jgi:tetratricopeptide (TPR) repeat protein
MSTRETFKIGVIEIPKISFPENIGAVLDDYMAANDVSCSYVAMCGIERPELIHDSTIDNKQLRLYAALKDFEAAPENGLAVLEIANALADLEDADGTKLVLESLEQSGGLHLYPVWYEDPMFHLGWFMADFKIYDEAINAYHKSLAKLNHTGKWAVWGHLGSVYHERGDYKQAGDCYQQALQSIETVPNYYHFDMKAKTEILKRLIDQATQQVPFTGKRIQYGIELAESYN